MYKFIVVLFCTILSACGGSTIEELHRVASSNTPDFIHKGELLSPYELEASPIVWNGELLYVVAYTNHEGVHTKIYRQSDKTLISDKITGLRFVSALVDNGTLHIFGTSQTTIVTMTTDNLVDWSEKRTIHTVSGGKIYNTSVAVDNLGYILAYEICEPNKVCFNAKFLHSTDLVSWSAIGGTYEVGYYTACPTIRYSDGFYYLFYLSNYVDRHNVNVGYFATNVSRSADLISWEFSPITVLSPLDGGDSMRNASDMDFIELDGNLHIIYYNGSQYGIVNQYAGLREANFAGTFSQFVAHFFTTTP